jgi:uncharacterized protein
MRLSKSEIQIITSSILKLDKNAYIYLFGSRVDDLKKGGDIDLLILSETLKASDKLDLLIDLKAKLGDQKLDLLIKNNSQYEADLFCQSLELVLLEVK